MTIDNTTPVVGETLTADASGIDDPDGLTSRSFTWRWLRVASDDTETEVGTAATYTVVAGDVGSRLKAEASFTDDDETDESVESAETATVEAVPTLPEVTVTHGGSPITEGGVATFTFTLSKTIGDLSLRVNIRRTETGNMIFPKDLGRSIVLFGPNQTTVTVSYTTDNDDVSEPDSTVTVEVLERDHYVPGTPSMASVEVRDDDDSPATGSVAVTTATTFTEGETLTADTSAIADEDGLDNAAYTYQWVRRPSIGSDADIAGATGATYTPVFADVDATFKVRVTVTDDEGHEATFTSAPTPAVAALPRPLVTVASDGDVTEGSPAVFTLTRTVDTTGTLDVPYDVAAAGDFGVTTGAGTATFLANDATVQVSVATTGDDTHEAHGSVTLTLTADTAADPAYLLGAPSTSAATAAVEDDDDSPTTGEVTVTGTAREGETLTADTSGLADGDGLDSAVWVYQWVRTPAGGSDEDISGATSQTYVPVYADADAALKVQVTVTDDESHRATFTSDPTSAVAARPRPSVTVASGGDVTEGDTVTFTLTRTGTTAQTLDVAYAVTVEGNFGVTAGAGTASFTAIGDTVQVRLDTTDDGAHEAHGSVTLTLTADTSADPAYLLGAPATATAAVDDDDDSPATGEVTVTGTAREGETLTADTSGLVDDDGLDSASYVYQWVRTPSGGSDEDISGATSKTYVPVSADLDATLKVKVTVTDDESHEATFTSAATAAVAAPLPEVTVMHDGSPVTEGGVATFTFTLSKTIGDIPLRVNITRTETGDMMSPSNLGRSVVVFGPNQTTLTVSYPTVADDTDEPNSTVTVEVLERAYYVPGTPSMASVEVQDDDEPELSIGDASVDEGDTGSTTLDFTVTLSEAATETVTVDWATSDGTATAGTDYTAAMGTLTFNSGDSSKTVSVTVAGDNVDEPNETLTVTLSGESGATIEDGAATGTITDDDATPTVTLVLTPDTIAEAGGVSTVTASLDHPSSEETTVTVSVTPQSPATGERLRAELEPGAEDCGRRHDEHGYGDDHRREQRRLRRGQDGDGVGHGDQRPWASAGRTMWS